MVVFKCQEDSFLKEFTSKVVLCEPAQLKRKNDKNKEEVIKGYNVIFENTILFPEGGGQPCDYGSVNDKPVLSVQRKGKDALHFVPCEVNEPPFGVGEEVQQTIDWDRRFDHMQQHSGQHLITAIFEREYNLDTISWWLGADLCYIEVDPNAEVTEEMIAKVEKICNELIMASTPVKVTVFDESFDKTESSDEVRSVRGLPKDHVGDIRVISIQGVDNNMCCGTHVSNLSQLLCVKMLNAEKVKNRQYINFIVGNRVLRKLHASYDRECQLNVHLKCAPSMHVEMAKKVQADLKATQRVLVKCVKELAANESEKLKSINPQPKWYSLHRKDGIDNDFITCFLRNAPEIKKGSDGLSLLFLSNGDETTHKGNFVIHGDETIVKDLGPTLCDLLDGKGNGKGNRFQARVNNLKRLPECEKLIAEYFAKRN